MSGNFIDPDDIVIKSKKDPKISVFKARNLDACVHWVDCNRLTKTVVQFLESDIMDRYCSKHLAELKRELRDG